MNLKSNDEKLSGANGNKSRIKTSKLSYKVSFSILLIIGILLFIAVFLIIGYIQNFMEHNTYEQYRRTGELFAKSIAQPFSRYDYYSIEKNCKNFLEDNSIVYVYVYDFSGFLINQSYTNREKIEPESIEKIKVNILTDDNSMLGQIEIGFDKTLVSKSLDMIKIIIFTGVVILIILLNILVFIVIKYNVSNPLSKLLFSIDKIIQGDYFHKMDIQSFDEIGEIGLSFNFMTEQLNKNISILNNIVEYMPSPIILIDERSRITKWNKMAEKWFDIKEIDCLGKNIYELNPYFKAFTLQINDVFIKKEPIILNRIKIEAGMLKDQYHTIAFYPLFFHVLFGVVIRIDNETESIKQMNNVIQIQKMESMGTLASGIAHDFNNILGGIKGTLSLMKLDTLNDNEIDKKELEENINILMMSSEKATQVVNQLLSLTRKTEVKYSIFDLNKSIKNIADICNNTFDRCVEIKIDYFNETANMYGVANQIEQAILNLCINGYHAMTIMRNPEDPKGGTLYISLTKSMITKSAYPEKLDENIVIDNKNYWLLQVQDSGVGIPKELLNKIFDPFFSTKDKSIGSGLGLSMVFNIVTNHKGVIHVYSEPEVGTSFNLYFPIYEGEVQIDEQFGAEGELYTGKGTVLIIDDDDVLREVAGKIFRKIGYKVLLTNNGEEGIRLFETRSNEICLLVLDLIMPKMSGEEVYNYLNKKFFLPAKKVPVILTTGLQYDDRAVRIKEQNNVFLLAKPYDLDEVSDLLKKIFI